jgi:hypothetical protein
MFREFLIGWAVPRLSGSAVDGAVKWRGATGQKSRWDNDANLVAVF